MQITAPNGQQSIMIGSVHIPIVGLRQPAAEVLDGAKRLVVESSNSQGPQPPDKSLQDTLDRQVYALLVTTGKLTRAAWATWLSDNQVLQLQEQLVCNQPDLQDQVGKLVEIILAERNAAHADAFAYTPCSLPGLLSRDNILAEAAAVRGIPTDTLETQVAVQRQRDAVPDRIYNESLRHAFTNEVQQEYAELTTALNAGDYEKVIWLVAKAKGPDEAAEYYQVMVAERNALWMPVLQRYLDDGSAVVVVGAAHLAGPNGLISLLEANNYGIRSIELPAGP